MKNFVEKNMIYYHIENMFSNVPENVVICIDESKANNIAEYLINHKECFIKDCSDDWKSKQKKKFNNRCVENCDSNSIKKYEYNGTCHENCSYYYYLDNENKYHCTQNETCPNTFPILLQDAKECVKTLLDELKIYEEINIKTMSENEQIQLYNEVLEKTEKRFTSGYDTSNIDIGHDDHLSAGNMRFTFTRADNQNNTKDDNMTKVHLGKCEEILRQNYSLSHNEVFYMRIVDYIQDNMDISKIQFDVYCKLDGTNFQKLKLTPCQGEKITLSIPKQLTGDLDRMNASSGYYNDKCISAKSDSGTDIPLKYRQIDFVVNNRTVCQEDCDFTFYNEKDNLINCSCYFKDINITFDDLIIDSNKLYDNFDDISDKKEISNVGSVLSCDSLNSTENIKSNPGFYSLIIILAIFIIIFIVFCSKGYNMLEIKMIEVIEKKFDRKKKKKKGNKIKNSDTKHNKKLKKRKSVKITEKHKKNYNIGSETSGAIALKRNSVQNFIQFNVQNNFTNVFQNETTLNTNANDSKLKPDTDYELNWLTYHDALIYDKRTNCDYYCSLIKNKQLFIFTFCSFNDYNSGIIKKFMLFLSFALHYTTNALFFDEDNLDQIFEDEGKYNFNYQLPKIISSAVISTAILRLMLQFLVLTDRDILYVKSQPTRDIAYNMKDQRLKYMKIKFAIFFILNFILLWLFWFYLTCFSAVYKNTQTYLIENTFISFGFSLFYPFIINIFPTIFRMCSLHSTNKNQACAYKISQFMQII